MLCNSNTFHILFFSHDISYSTAMTDELHKNYFVHNWKIARSLNEMWGVYFEDFGEISCNNYNNSMCFGRILILEEGYQYLRFCYIWNEKCIIKYKQFPFVKALVFQNETRFKPSALMLYELWMEFKCWVTLVEQSLSLEEKTETIYFKYTALKWIRFNYI